MDNIKESNLDFSNTEIAFSNKSNKELKKMSRLFQLMNKAKLVNIFSSIGLFSVKYNLPFAKWGVRQTIFEQFVEERIYWIVNLLLKNYTSTIHRLF